MSSGFGGQAAEPPGERPRGSPIRLPGSLRAGLTLLVVVAMLPAFLLLVHSGIQRRRDALRAAGDAAQGLARAASRGQEEAFDEARQILYAIGLLPSIRGVDPEKAEPILRRLLAESDGYLNFGIIGPDGMVAASAMPAEDDIDLSDRTYFQRALRDRRFSVGQYQVGRITGRASINVGQPMVDPDGEVRGVLFAALDLEWLRSLSARVPLPEGSVLLVLDETGTLVVRYPPAGEGGTGPRRPGEDLLQGLLARSEGEVSSGGFDGVRRRFGFTALRSGGEATGACVAVGLPEDVVTAAAESDLQRSLLLAGLAAAVAVGGAWLFGRRLVLHPVDRLLRAIRRVGAEGEAGLPPGERGGEGSGGELGALEVAFGDMARSLEARTRDLRLAEGRYRQLVEMMPAVFYLARAGDRIHLEYVSPQIAALTGHDADSWAGRGGDWEELVHPTDRDRVRAERTEALERGEPFQTEYRIVAADGREVWVRDRAVVLHGSKGEGTSLRGFLVDITERKSLEGQFLQAQKMEAVGRLAAGVAHDFNNLLTVITGYSQILQGQLKGDRRVTEPLHEIHLAAERAGGLTRQLLSFSRRQALDPVVLDLNASLALLDPMVRRLIGEQIFVESDLAPDLGPILVDRGRIDQIVMNLVVNARDAMPDGGRLTVATGDVDLDADYVRRHVGVRPGRYVCLTVADTGCGMEDAVRERIFEPFFTTKGEGEGTGLGLSTVYAIVHQAGGHVEVYSAPWRGTTFKVYFPRCDGAPLPASAAGRRTSRTGAAGTVLLVEDDRRIRDLAREVLEQEGHTVLEAGSLEAARGLALSRGDLIQVLVCDLHLPDGNGLELVRELLASRPALRAVVVSGSLGEDLPGGEFPGGVAFLAKPFRPADLKEVVARVLA